MSLESAVAAMADEIVGTHVEIIEQSSADPNAILVPNRVLIDGRDVGWLAEDGISVKAGSAVEPTTVTLVLMPARVTIRHESLP